MLRRRAQALNESIAGTVERGREAAREHAPNREQIQAAVQSAGREATRVLEDGSGRKDSPTTREMLANAERLGEVEAPVDATAEPIGRLDGLNQMATLDGDPNVFGGIGPGPRVDINGGIDIERLEVTIECPHHLRGEFPSEPPSRRSNPGGMDDMMGLGGLSLGLGGGMLDFGGGRDG